MYKQTFQPGNYPHGQEYVKQWAALGAWFLGPKAENIDVFNNLAIEAFKGHANFRKKYFPTDSAYITTDITATEAYKGEKKQLEQELATMVEQLKNSTPMFSVRFEGHMNWDTTLPGNLGYLAALLYNANNVTNESSAITTAYEIEVGNQLCEMLGYKFTEPKTDPWGHITSCGSIANIEALWACRNIKYYPFCVQKALNESKELARAKDFKVYVPRLQSKQKLVDLSNWDLLNLDIDDIVAMPAEVIDMCDGVTSDDYSKIVNKNNLASVGWWDFMETNGLKKGPVVLSPMTNHYSWPKAASMLGIGQGNIIGIEFDENARMDIEDLKSKLDYCLRTKTPVISVVAVIGTTEESAVDPLADIVDCRNEYKKQGLNFAINADAAWGGYFMTMLHKPTQNRWKSTAKIPVFPLSDYTTHHLLSMKHADTVTVDPHKSGFCPYPAGGLCYRNGNMRGFIQVEASVIYHQGLDPAVGIWGIEGSKPGAAPAGVLLSHRDPEAMEFLKAIGPDTLINAFAVNLKDNTDLGVCNKINFEIFRRLSHTNPHENVMRVPLILTSSQLRPMIFGKAVKQFKQRLGLPANTDGELGFLINTVMNPWVAELQKIKEIGSIFRQTVLDAIGMVTDTPDLHGFVSPDMITDTGDLFGDHLPLFTMPVHQYHAIAKFNVLDQNAVTLIQGKYKEQSQLAPGKRLPIIFVNTEKSGLQNFLEDAMNEALDMDFFVGPPSATYTPFLTTKVKVLDIPRRKHIDMTLRDYPAKLTYFMYGNPGNAYLSHNVSVRPDVHQVVKLDKKPADVPDILLELGIDVTINNLEGKPLYIDGKIVDPLQLQEYSISYSSIDGIIAQSTIYMTNDDAKVWFNAVDE
ncbi:hypothetical protein ACF0H5_016386 [Mactra antiquata]